LKNAINIQKNVKIIQRPKPLKAIHFLEGKAPNLITSPDFRQDFETPDLPDFYQQVEDLPQSRNIETEVYKRSS